MSNISYHQGDVLDSEAWVICHQVNCRGTMGKGLARGLKTRLQQGFPRVVGGVAE